MVISVYGFGDGFPNRDPARLAAQVISGIGFLGAGTIVQTGTDIKGLTTATTLWVVMAIVFVPGLDVWLSAACGLVVGVAGVIGDLFESRVKRGVGVKDSGNFLPGHGGLLDRSDSMFFGGMAAFFLLHFGGVL